jgi:peptide/nickel transport system substrate-binding protein
MAVVLAASCSMSPTETASPRPSAVAPSGGTLRIIMPADQQEFGRFLMDGGHPGALDPHLDAYSSYDSWELLRCCLARTLLSNNGRSTEEGGARLHPDLAAEMPDISADGLSWTFRLKQGLHYGPPMQDVEIVASDVIRALHRLMAPALVDGSWGRALYTDIVGAQAFLDGEATSIAGLESPDKYTLVIRLTKPAGDLGARLAVALPVPIPPSPSNPGAPFGVADGHDDGYGRFFVSSGPYMLEGSAELDFSLPPAEQAPVAGLVPGQRISLVRNPSWDAASDPLRPAMPDRIEFAVAPSVDQAAAEIYAKRADLLLNYYGIPQQIPAAVADAVRADPSLGRIHVNEADFTAGIMMNLAQPPFDDLHLRKAVSHVTNRRRIVELLGGPLTLRVAHHMVPDSMEDNLLVDYRPYQSANDEGDLAAAMAEMRQSAYDTDGDGICDAAACSGIPALARDVEPFPAVAQSVRDDLAKIGVDLDLQEVSIDDFFATYGDPASQVAIFVPLGWVKDALSPANFFTGQFYSPVALADTGNGSLVGATPAQLAEWGYADVEVPNVDERIEACLPLTGSAQFECWAALDQHMMENVVPTVMYGSGVGVVLASTRVVGYSWDQLAGAPAFDRIVLAP